MAKATGRPPIAINADTVQALARIHCTLKEIGAVVGCSVDTLERRFAEVIEKGKEEGKASLRRMQFDAAKGGNATMMIWLGKQMLGQTDQQQMTHAGDMTFSLKVQTARDDG